MRPFHFARRRRITISSLAFLLLFTTSAPAMIMVGKGNAPMQDPGWPTGALAVANLKTRLGWYEGPPFGGGQWCLMYRGDQAALADGIKAFGAIRAASLQIYLHDGPQNNQFLQDEKNPKADTNYDFAFTCWVPASWHRLFNDPRTTFMADSPNFRKPVDAPRLDVYLTGKLDWSKITVPQGVQVIDQRGAGDKKATASVIRGDVFDMGSGKPVAGAEIRVEVYKTPANKYEAGASGKGDNDGRFEVANVPSGHCRVIVSAPGFAPRMIGYEEFKDGEARKYSIELSKTVKLSGTVIDTDDKPLVGIVVRVSNTMGIDGRGYSLPELPQTKSDENGKFTIEVPTGYGQFWAYEEGFYHLEGLKLHAFPEDTATTIQMIATGMIKGKVVDAKGKPAGGGTINVNPPGDPIGKWGGSMNVAADGTFQFENVPPGPYTISTMPQYHGDKVDPNAKHVTVDSGKILEVTVTKTK